MQAQARREGLAAGLPFAEGSFDGVMGILAPDFMTGRETVRQEMERGLRPGGFVAAAILNRFSLWTLKRIVRAWFKPSP